MEHTPSLSLFLVKPWSNTGQTLVKLWSNSGQTLVNLNGAHVLISKAGVVTCSVILRSYVHVMTVFIDLLNRFFASNGFAESAHMLRRVVNDSDEWACGATSIKETPVHPPVRTADMSTML